MERRHDGSEHVPNYISLPDGRTLSTPFLTTAQSLRIGDWVFAAGPWQISDVRFRHDGGRVIHLHGRPPLGLGVRDVLPVYQHVSAGA